MQLKAVPVISMQVVDNASAYRTIQSPVCFLSLVPVVHHKIPHLGLAQTRSVIEKLSINS